MYIVSVICHHKLWSKMQFRMKLGEASRVHPISFNLRRHIISVICYHKVYSEQSEVQYGIKA